MAGRIRDEIAAIYAANPGLREELDELERQLDRGVLELIDNDVILRRARHLADRPAKGRTPANGPLDRV